MSKILSKLTIKTSSVFFVKFELTHGSGISTYNVEQVNVGWEIICHRLKLIIIQLLCKNPIKQTLNVIAQGNLMELLYKPIWHNISILYQMGDSEKIIVFLEI